MKEQIEDRKLFYARRHRCREGIVMPKRSGLGQRGLDLLIPASSQSSKTDSEGERESGKKEYFHQEKDCWENDCRENDCRKNEEEYHKQRFEDCR